MARKTPEGRFKDELTQDLKDLFPGCRIFKNDEQQLQGVPDMLILWGPYWAMLEAKASADAAIQPNQEYWVEHFNEMSFAAFVYPENKEDVLHALQQTFEPRRKTRLPQR